MINGAVNKVTTSNDKRASCIALLLCLYNHIFSICQSMGVSPIDIRISLALPK